MHHANASVCDRITSPNYSITVWRNHRRAEYHGWEITIYDESKTIKRCFFSGNQAEMETLFAELTERLN